MKKALLILLTFIIFPLIYAGWPIYQGLAYKEKVPMFGFDYLTWPTQQPTSSQLLNSDYRSVEHLALEALKKQQAEVLAPGYTAAVAINGELVWAGSVGWADIAKKTKMTTETQLRIGSTSKAVTATGLARLVANNKLNLDDPLSSYFNLLPNPKWSNITARQLASHMAGIPHYKDNTELFGLLETISSQTHYPNVLDAITLFDESEVLFKPGEQFSYSSLGTVLLSALMQVKAQQKYQNFMHKEVFEPLNMLSTFTETPSQTSSNIATFYWRDEHQPTQLKPWYNLDLSHRLAGGGWVSTSKDLVALGQAFMDDKFIPAKVRETFWTAQKLNNNETNPQGYGIGWRVHDLNLGEGFRIMKYMHHGGVSAGAQSFLMVIPEYKISISVNANFRTKEFWDFGKVSYELARIFIKEIEK